MLVSVINAGATASFGAIGPDPASEATVVVPVAPAGSAGWLAGGPGGRPVVVWACLGLGSGSGWGWGGETPKKYFLVSQAWQGKYEETLFDLEFKAKKNEFEFWT